MGDWVIISEDEKFVKEQFRLIGRSQLEMAPYLWALFRPMLGKTYTVVPKQNDGRHLHLLSPIWVAVPSPDPKSNGPWYFPRTTVTKVQYSKSLFLIQFICFYCKEYFEKGGTVSPLNSYVSSKNGPFRQPGQY